MSENKEIKQEKNEQKGLQVSLDEQGQITLKTFGKINDLEMIGLINYVDMKRDELLKYMGTSPEVKSLALMTKVAEGVGAILKVLGGQNSEKAEEGKTTEES